MEQAEGIKPQQEVNHAGIAADDHAADFLRGHPHLCTQLFQQCVEGVHRHLPQLLPVLRVVFGVENPAQNLIAVGTLAVAHRILPQNAAEGKVQDAHNHRGAAQIHRRPVAGPASVPRLHPGHPVSIRNLLQSHGILGKSQGFIGGRHQLRGKPGRNPLSLQCPQAPGHIVRPVRIQFSHGQANLFKPTILHASAPFLLMFFSLYYTDSRKKSNSGFPRKAVINIHCFVSFLPIKFHFLTWKKLFTNGSGDYIILKSRNPQFHF